jgi:hypothetical protein
MAMDIMVAIAKVDRKLTKLAHLVVSSPLAMLDVDSLLDQRLTLMAQRDIGWATRNRRRWRR